MKRFPTELALFAAAALLIAPCVASAHGGRVRTYDVLVASDDPRHVVVLSTIGIFDSIDGGASFRFTCGESVPSWEPGALRRAVMLPGGVILWASEFGLLRGEGHGCGPWSYDAESLAGRIVSDVVRAPDRDDEAIALTVDLQTGPRLHRVSDSGRAATAFGGAMPAALIAESVRYAPSDPQVLYVAGIRTVSGMPRGQLLRSENGGATFVLHTLALEPTERSLKVLAVDPEQPSRVFVLVAGDEHDRVVVSDDGGATQRDFVRTPAPPPVDDRPFALAFVADGSVWLGSRGAGWLRAPRDGSPEPIDPALGLACVVRDGEHAWICADGYPDELGDGYALGRVSAEARSPVPMLRFRDVTQRGCGTAADRTCEHFWGEYVRDTGRDLEPRDGGVVIDGGAHDGRVIDAGAIDDAGVALDGALDAGTPLDAAVIAPRGSGGCAVARGRAPGAPLCALALALLLSRAWRGWTRRSTRSAPARSRPRAPR